MALLFFLSTMRTFGGLHSTEGEEASSIVSSTHASPKLRGYDPLQRAFVSDSKKHTCIAALVSNSDEDVKDLTVALKSLRNLKVGSETKILIFYEEVSRAELAP